MRVLYVDCFSGISGDMCLGALIDLGLPIKVLQDVADQLGLPLAIRAKTVKKRGLRAIQVAIEGLAPQPPHRSYLELLEILENSQLPETIRNRVKIALERLAAAEAAAHGCDPKEVHFHELGGLDTLIDLAGVYQGVAYLGVDRITISPLPLGRGEIKTAHGLIPLPAPATLHLLRGIPTRGVAITSELVTPTGAVLAATLGHSFGTPPNAIWERFGSGAGRSDLPSQANLLRMLLGQGWESRHQGKADAIAPTATGDQTEAIRAAHCPVSGVKSGDKGTDHPEPVECVVTTADDTQLEGQLAQSYAIDSVIVIETQIDDNNPELLPYLRERLQQRGALDVTFTPTLMKKGRPGVVLTVLTDHKLLTKIAETIFRESSAIGLRWYQSGRIKLYRSSLMVSTPYGEVPVKVSYRLQADGNHEILNIAPEYEDCARCAERYTVSVKEVYQATIAAARSQLKP